LNFWLPPLPPLPLSAPQTPLTTEQALTLDPPSAAKQIAAPTTVSQPSVTLNSNVITNTDPPQGHGHRRRCQQCEAWQRNP
jgi:hypothetical protein